MKTAPLPPFERARGMPLPLFGVLASFHTV